MSSKKETELAKVDPATLALPDYIAKGRTGFETVDAQDVMFERLSLMQDLSPDVKGKKFDVGDLVRRSTEEVIFRRGMKPVPFVIVYYFKEYVEFGDRDDPKSPAVVNRSLDRNSPLAEECRQWVKKKQGDGKLVRKVQDVHNFGILLDGRPLEPVLVACMKSNYKAGTALLTLANGRGDAPLYAGRYLISTADETNKRNQTYSVLKFRADTEHPWASKEMYEAAEGYYKRMAEAFKAGKLKGNYDKEDADHDEGGASAADEKEL